jgi:hypothetical protein
MEVYMRKTVAVLVLAILGVSIAYGTEIRLLGDRDMSWGSGTWVSTGGATVYRINADIIPFSADNSAKVGDLFPYATALDNGTLDYCMKWSSAGVIYWGACGTGGSTTSLPWDNITSRPTINSVTVTGAVLDNASNYPAALARLASPTFTGTVTVPTPFTIGAVEMTATGTELNYVVGVTSDLQSQLDAKAALISPSFTTPTLGAAVATTLNTGQGANELYGMDQGVKTTDNVVFSSVTTDEWVTTCIASDNACGIGLGNQSDPTGSNLEAAQLWMNTTSNMWKSTNGDNSAVLEVFTSGAAHTLNFATSGTLMGAIKVLTDNTTPVAADLYGVLFLWTQAGTTTLPTAVAGMSACILDSGTAHDLILDVQAGDDIEMTAGQQTNGVGITNASGSSTADFACVIAPSAGHWALMGSRGTWASQ